MAAVWDEGDLLSYILRMYQEAAAGVIDQVNTWLARGDGVAVYVNQDLGHPELGWPRLASYGSDQALLEPYCEVCRGRLDTNMVDDGWVHLDDGHEDHVPVYPPQRLPDLPTQINWRYRLEATYRGGLLPAPVGPFDVDMSPAASGPDWEWPDE